MSRVRSLGAGIALYFVSTGACTDTRPGDHYTLYLDPAFTSSERADITAGLLDWTSNVPVTLRVVAETCSGFSDGVICTHRAATTADLPPGAEDVLGATKTSYGTNGTRGDTGGWRGTDGGELWVDISQVSSAATQGITAALSATFNHELGHGMGLIHHSTWALMYPTIWAGSPCVTCDDIAQWYYVRFRVGPVCTVADAKTD
jgi:hypothetical protein